MARIVVTAQVENAKDWETKYRTHGDLFRRQGVHSPVSYTTNNDNEVALYLEVDDADEYLKAMESPETADAMAQDGVKRESVKFFVLDRDWSL